VDVADGQGLLWGLDPARFFLCVVDDGPDGALLRPVSAGSSPGRSRSLRRSSGATGWLVLTNCPRCSLRYGVYCSRHDGSFWGRRHAGECENPRLVDETGQG
jgi:hypothetical protein